MPLLDQGLSVLIEDLHARGLDQDVSVVVWGEFGRTPIINKEGGRDHWPRVSCALLAGGGMKHGQVIGSSERDGGVPKDRPVTPAEIAATIYQFMGVPLDWAYLDSRGRPRPIVEENARPIHELG